MSKQTIKDIYRKEPISDRNTILTFGKYKGYSIDDILDVNPNYLIWLHSNNDFFELHADLLDEAEASPGFRP